MKVLVTGSSGLIGSEAVEHFDREGHEVLGVDNNMRRVFFGPAGDTLWNLERLKNTAWRCSSAAPGSRACRPQGQKTLAAYCCLRRGLRAPRGRNARPPRSR